MLGRWQSPICKERPGRHGWSPSRRIRHKLDKRTTQLLSAQKAGPRCSRLSDDIKECCGLQGSNLREFALNGAQNQRHKKEINATLKTIALDHSAKTADCFIASNLQYIYIYSRGWIVYQTSLRQSSRGQTSHGQASHRLTILRRPYVFGRLQERSPPGLDKSGLTLFVLH